MNFKVLWIAGLMLAATAGQVQAGFINFESFAGDAMLNSPGSTVPVAAQISNQFLASDGVSFSSGGGYLAAVELGTGTFSGHIGVGGTTSTGQLTYSGDYFIATFFNPANLLELGVTNFVSVRGDTVPDGSTVTFSAFDINNNLLGSDTQTETTGGHLFSLSFAGIHSVKFSGSGTVALDDFTFNAVTSAAPVPEPSSIAMWGLGALGLMFARRKRQQKKLAA